MKKKKIIRGILIAIAVSIIVFASVIVIYINDYYHASDRAIVMLENDLNNDNGNYKVVIGKDKEIALIPNNPKAGIIFYPGGKVEQQAYYPLMAALADDGYECILLKAPFNLAIFNINMADGMIERYGSDIDWYIGGHSLGGSAAAMYLEKHNEEYSGLILLASYSSVDLSNTDLNVISIYGSRDLVLNSESYSENIKNLPDYEEFIIDGGCHAYFGMYGAQDGDGAPLIENDEQILITESYINQWISNNR